MDTSLAIPNEGMFDRIGLTESPFPVTPDASRYFCSKRLEAHVLELMHCIHMRKGFLLFTADIGLGKSTLSRYLINNLEQQKTDVSLVLNTFLQGVELLKAINEDFGLTVEGGVKEQLDALNTFLLEQYAKGQNCLIIIDDAQNLTTESLEMIRLISNFEVSTHKLVQILLIAQPEIMLTLNLPQIRQLKSRIALHIELSPFSELEVHDYVYFKLNGAGNTQNITLLPKAIKRLHQISKGYPRRINLIMDRALYALLVDASSVINEKIIVLANNDLEQTQRLVDADRNPKSSKRRTAMYAASLIALAGITALFMQYTGFKWVNGLEATPNVVTESYASSSLVSPVEQKIQKTQSKQIVVKAVQKESEPLTEAVDVTEVIGETRKAPNDVTRNSEVLDMIVSSQVKTKTNLPGLVDQDIKTLIQSEELAQDTVFMAFLNSYALGALYPELIEHYQQQNWHELKKMFLKHNWTLLLNNEAFIEPARSVLKVTTQQEGARWLMLWQPMLSFEKYHFGLRSEQVGVLQKLLKSEGFFTGEEDATIGSHTMYAVANFQRSLGIEPTGKADSLTLYFLTKDNGALKRFQ